MIQEKEKENENNNIQRQKQIQLNKSIQNKEYKQVDLSKFNFNPLIIIKLVINRMEEIDKIVDKNKKPSLQLKYDFNLPNIPEENFNDFKELKVKKLYNLGINFCSKLMKNICEKDIPFADQAAYILFDCSGFINIKNKLKMFLIICGLTNALNIVNIPYTLILIGDSEDYFKNKKRKEKGIYYFNNDDKYEWDFKNGKKERKGIFYYNDGDKYKGDFKNEKREGKGVYYCNNGDFVFLKSLSCLSPLL